MHRPIAPVVCFDRSPTRRGLRPLRILALALALALATALLPAIALSADPPLAWPEDTPCNGGPAPKVWWNCNASAIPLTQGDLSDYELKNVILTDTNLDYTNFDGAQATGLWLGGSSAIGSSWRGFNGQLVAPTNLNLFPDDTSVFNLTGADFTGATLVAFDARGSNLSNAMMNGSRWSAVVLTDADLSGADLTGVTDSATGEAPTWFEANAVGANLSGVTWFDGTHCKDGSIGTCISACDDPAASEVDWTHCDKSGASFAQADLSRAVLHETNFAGSDLSGTDLSASDLSEADLSGTDLSGANLMGADLTGILVTSTTSFANATWIDGTGCQPTSLGGCVSDCLLPQGPQVRWSYCKFAGRSFEHAQMWESRLDHADLSRADFTKANLARSDLSGANLAGATLYDADLTGATIDGVDWTNADLIGATWIDGSTCDIGHSLGQCGTSCAGPPGPDADWHGCDKTHAQLADVDLSGANLMGADFTGADLSGANLDNCDLTEAILDQADLSGAQVSALLQEASLEQTQLTGATMTSAHLNNADLEGAVLTDADLENADLEGADLTGATVDGVDWTGANLEGAIWTDGAVCQPGSIGKCIDSCATPPKTLVDWQGCNKSGADLHGAPLMLARLQNVDFSGADLDHANLYRADLTGANLSRANLTSANLSKTVLIDADLTGADIMSARLTKADLSGATWIDGSTCAQGSIGECMH